MSRCACPRSPPGRSCPSQLRGSVFGAFHARTSTSPHTTMSPWSPLQRVRETSFGISRRVPEDPEPVVVAVEYQVAPEREIGVGIALAVRQQEAAAVRAVAQRVHVLRVRTGSVVGRRRRGRSKHGRRACGGHDE